MKNFLKKIWNSIVHSGAERRCELCGRPMQCGRPYILDIDTGKVEPSFYYKCTCYTRQENSDEL